MFFVGGDGFEIKITVGDISTVLTKHHKSFWFTEFGAHACACDPKIPWSKLHQAQMIDKMINDRME